MRKKRKGSELLRGNSKEVFESTDDSESIKLKIRHHHSVEDYVQLKKRCKEDVVVSDDPVGSCKSKLAGIAATAPPCSTVSLVSLGRGIKRKIGCIDLATQIRRKKKIEGDYIFGATIGKGKYGSVRFCRSKVSGKEFACKTLAKGGETVHREVEIMQHLSGNPGVVTLEAVYEDSESFHLVMELCSGGRLIDQMEKEAKYSEQQAANIFKELMLVIKYCHEMGVVHRDVKPENILLTSSGKIKLADFGLAMRITTGQRLAGLAGSPSYVAPEVISGNYSEKADVWSAGVLLYALLAGVLPFQGDSLEAVFEAVKTKKLDFHTGMWESVSKPARDLLERILTRNAASRISADEVLSHPWISFYTERSLRTLSFKSKLKKQAGPTPQIPASSSTPVATRSRVPSTSPIKYTSPLSISRSPVHETEERDDFGFIDALAVAISHVRISEPKRSRLCGSISPIREQHSSTMSALCEAC